MTRVRINAKGNPDEACPKKKPCIGGGIISALSNPPNTSKLPDSKVTTPQQPQQPPPQQQPQPPPIIEDALSNYVVLRNIFTILNDNDLETCCHVSQYWRTVADPMVCLHYDIQLGKENNFDEEHHDPWESEEVVIKARAKYNHKSFTEYESNFEGVTKTLEEVLRTEKVSISLKVFATTDIRSESVKLFLAKFGPLVLNLAFIGVATLPLNLFCKLLLNSFPNLRKLNCTGLEFELDSAEDRDFDTDLPQNQHKHLRKISFRNYGTCTVQSFWTILKIAPHLEEIQRLPLQLINAVLAAQKGQVLKSLAYIYDEPWLLSENGESVITAFQKLAELQPKLTDFCLLPSSFPTEEENTFQTIKPFVFSVLESSRDSLESLCLTTSDSYGFQNFPRLEALKTLEFSGLDDHADEGLFFPAEMSMTDTFPNVSGIIIGFPVKENLMNEYLPENIISPWGSQIKTLRVRGLRLNSLPLLHRRFPSVQEFTLLGSANEIRELLPALEQFWPSLKSLTIGVSYGCVPRNNTRPGVLDCAFTGLSEDVVNQLLDSSTRGNFTDEEIQRFKDASPMNKLKELRELKLILRNSLVVGESVEKLTRMTQVANEFGFSLVPQLKVTVGIWRNHKFAEVIKTALEPLAQSKNILIDDYYFDGEWSV